MYFPSLNHLLDYDFDPLVINRFDTWLGTLTGRKRMYIRPARFAVDMEVDYNTSNELFSISAIKLSLFQINYEVYCPDCPHSLVKIVNNLDDIPERVKCHECGMIFNPFDNEEYIQITFSLIKNPDPNSPKSQKRKHRKKLYSQIKPVQKLSELKDKAYNLSTFLESPYSREEIDNAIFRPDWDEYDKAYNRFISTLKVKKIRKKRGML